MAGNRRSIDNRVLIESWLKTATPEHAHGLQIWLHAASWDAERACHGWVKRTDGRRLHFAYVRRAGCLITFLIFDAPVRVVRLITIIDDPLDGLDFDA